MNQPKKQTKSKPVISKQIKAKESKTDTFIRLAKPRVENVLRTLRILGNCSKRNNYEYTQEQIDKIYATLQEGLNNMINKYTPSKKEQESFEF